MDVCTYSTKIYMWPPDNDVLLTEMYSANNKVSETCLKDLFCVTVLTKHHLHNSTLASVNTAGASAPYKPGQMAACSPFADKRQGAHLALTPLMCLSCSSHSPRQ